MRRAIRFEKHLPGFLVLAVFLWSTCAWGSEEFLDYGRFGKLTLYRNSPQPSHVVLFVSGDGGWNLGVIDMAQSLAGLDALVVGIDITHYLGELSRSKEKCSYPAADFETLSKFIQKKLNFDRYQPPVLVGYSSGATLVYALLAQAPPNTFCGAISMGFCPDLPLNKPFCGGRDLQSEPFPKELGYNFLPTNTLENPWIALQGTIDLVCAASAVEAYVKQVNNGALILLPKVGHGFSVQKNWLPQFREAFASLVSADKPVGLVAAGSAISDLPLVEVPAQGSSSDMFAVMLSGDGGWASIDRDVAESLAAKGIPVVGLNTLQYFWTARTPDLAGKDLERIIRHYQVAWKHQSVILIGYSLGADVLPFMASRQSDELRQQVAAVALLGPGKTANFEFHLSDWLGGGDQKGLPTLPEVEKLSGMKVLCLYGEEEQDSLCQEQSAQGPMYKAIALKGGHHFGGDYVKLTDLIHAASMEK
jgi:type IV secretory pathway VirJ component